jgi:hypothetical protein
MTLEYKLNYNHIGQKRKYKLSKQKRLKITDSCSWIENDLKNQWYFKDYNCFYIVISKFKEDKFKVSCSGANAGEYKSLEEAKKQSFIFCNNYK